MSERLKKILIILGFIGVIGLVAFSLYFVFFRAAPPGTYVPPSVTNTNTNTTGGLPSSGAGTPTAGTPTTPVTPPSPIASGGPTKTTRLTSAAILSPTLTGDGKSMAYFDPTDGRFYKIGADGKVIALSSKQFLQARTIVWDKSADSVVIEFPDGSNVIFDFTTQQQTTLPAHWQDFGFSPAGTEIIAKSITNDSAASSIIITNKDASNTQIIAGLGSNANLVDINWSPNDSVVAFSDTASGAISGGLGRKMIYPIGKNEENYKGLIIEGLNFHASWSPDGSKILYDVAGPTSDYKPMLWIVDGTPATMGNNRSSLGLNTWVDKCTFENSTSIYCAVPSQMDINSGLQPDVVTSNDTVYHIDLTTGKVRLVGIPDQQTQMHNLAVSTDGKYLYYTDKSSRLQMMRLK